MGQATVGTVISTNSTQDERVLFTQIYNYIMGLWNGITCTVTNGEDDPITSATPSDIVWTPDEKTYIDFTLKTNVVLRFETYPEKYSQQNIGISRGYNVFFIINGNIIGHMGNNDSKTNSQGTLKFYGRDDWPGHGVNPYDGEERRYVFSKYIDSNIFIVWFGEHLATSWKEDGFFIMGLKDTSGNWHYSAGAGKGYNYTNGDAIENTSVYDSNGTNACLLSKTFNYEAKTGYIDFISHSNYSSAGTKVFSTGYIYDCTTVDFGDTLSVKNGANFLAIGSNSMVILN